MPITSHQGLLTTLSWGGGGQPQTYFSLKPLQFVPGKCFEARMISSVKWEILVNKRHCIPSHSFCLSQNEVVNPCSFSPPPLLQQQQFLLTGTRRKRKAVVLSALRPPPCSAPLSGRGGVNGALPAPAVTLTCS